MALTLVYCGADMPWKELQKHGFRRRNTCLLQAFSQHPEVQRVFVINRVGRFAALTMPLRLWRRWRERSEKVLDIAVSTGLIPERSWLRGSQRLNVLLARLQIAIQTGLWNSSNTMVWCHWPAGYRLATRLRLAGQWVFDADHNILADENESAGSKIELERILLECSQQVDLAVAGSPSILEWFEKNGSAKTLRVRNAVNPSRFSDASSQPRKTASGTPHIGYVGILSPWMNFDLLREIVALRPDWSYTIAGKTYKMDLPQDLKSAPNVQFLDYLPPQDVPAFITSLDVGLGLYRKGAGSDGDSMKFYEYLAAGVPIVTTPFHDVLASDFNHLLEIANTAKEFVAAIERLLARGEDRRHEWEFRARTFVNQNTWVTRATEILKALELTR